MLGVDNARYDVPEDRAKPPPEQQWIVQSAMDSRRSIDFLCRISEQTGDTRWIGLNPYLRKPQPTACRLERIRCAVLHLLKQETLAVIRCDKCHNDFLKSCQDGDVAATDNNP